MQCFFCENPAAHPSTGSQYTEKALACHECAVNINKWVRNHTNKRQRKNSQGVETQDSFYEAATKYGGNACRRIKLSEFLTRCAELGAELADGSEESGLPEKA